MGNKLSEFLDTLASVAEYDLLEIAFSFTSDLVGIAVYVLIALALFTIAKRRGIASPWLAWVPVTQFWIIGSLADHYRLVACGEKTCKRKVLLWLQIIKVALVIAIFVAIVIAALSMLKAGYNNYNDPLDMPLVILSLCGVVAVCLAFAGVLIASAVVQYVALYDIYRSCDPKNVKLYLTLSIIFDFTQAIFLMICRNKDNGMPCNNIDPFLPKNE